jgi:hypothetical protein
VQFLLEIAKTMQAKVEDGSGKRSIGFALLKDFNEALCISTTA